MTSLPFYYDLNTPFTVTPQYPLYYDVTAPSTRTAYPLYYDVIPPLL